MTRNPATAPRRPRGGALRAAVAALLAVLAIAGGGAMGAFVVDRVAERSPQAVQPTSTPPASIPVADIPGEDLVDLPRFPGSTRTSFLREQQGTTAVTAIEYVTGGELDDVRAFYRHSFREHDWDLIELDFSGGEWIFLVGKGARAALVEIESHERYVGIEIELEVPVASTTPPPVPPPDDDDGDD